MTRIGRNVRVGIAAALAVLVLTGPGRAQGAAPDQAQPPPQAPAAPPAAPQVAPPAAEAPAQTPAQAPAPAQTSNQPAAQAPAAQQPPAAQQAPAVPSGTPATVLDTQDYEGLIGRSVRSAANEDMGRIIDVILDKEGRARAAIIDFGGFLGVGSRKIAVDWRALQFGGEGRPSRVVLQLNRNQVRVSPEYKPGEPIVVLGPASPSAPAQAAAQPAATQPAPAQTAPAPAAPAAPGPEASAASQPAPPPAPTPSGAAPAQNGAAPAPATPDK